jgi:hypothetical protein
MKWCSTPTHITKIVLCQQMPVEQLDLIRHDHAEHTPSSFEVKLGYQHVDRPCPKAFDCLTQLQQKALLEHIHPSYHLMVVCK